MACSAKVRDKICRLDIYTTLLSLLTYTTLAGSAADGSSAHMSDVFLTRVTSSGSMPPTQHVLLDEAGVDFAIDIKVLSGGDLVFLTTHSEADHRSPGDRSGYGGDFVMRVYRVQPSYIISGAMQLSDGTCGAGCVWMKEYTTDEGRR